VKTGLQMIVHNSPVFIYVYVPIALPTGRGSKISIFFKFKQDNLDKSGEPHMNTMSVLVLC